MVNPYFHMFGLKAGILACVAAAPTMLPEPMFDVDQVLERIADERRDRAARRADDLPVDPRPSRPRATTTCRACGSRSPAPPTSRSNSCGGSIDEMPFRRCIAGYGLTEGGTATGTSPDDDAETIATTVGRPRPGFELRIVDHDDNEVPAARPARSCSEAGRSCRSYLDDPEATAAGVVARRLAPNRRSSARSTSAGNLRIVGRAKDMFIVGGFNAYPAEIENALLRHPDIQQAAVIGIPDERLGEVGMAFVVLARTRPPPRTTSSRGPASRWPTTRRHAESRSSTSSRCNATGKVVKDELRRRAAV